MDYLWSPWRFRYIRSNADGELKRSGCVFCLAPEAPDPASALVVGRGARCYVILNLYPYTSGHLMVVPYLHSSSLSELDGDTTAEMMELAKRAQHALTQIYRPDGFNLGINLGSVAGAGIAEHLHMHVVPRWEGDANFMSVIGETRVIPEELSTTYEKLRPYFAEGMKDEG
jgi:ATP adenylyltransferase